ncbi:MAG: DegT/DnrJ/EryC1/StrS family aminotransferase [Parcubacteria group bacterium]|nr:DegT/DnrJ/EryC1/StrS family aminotransferase [Parcubacteria group bacterium]
MKVEYFRHNVEEEDIENVVSVLRGLFLTTGGVAKEFENKFSEYLGIPYVVGVTSCTAALHLSLIAAGVESGDEVITTPMSFIATANAIEYVGARPVFVDVNIETGNIDENKIEEAITPRTKAIIPVHLYGQLCDMKKIKDIADKYSLKIIEDAAHAVESGRSGYRTGELANFSCFSFYAIKNITSGEGGAIAVHDEKIAEKLKKLRLHGMSKDAAERYEKKYKHYDMDVLGWKYNMTNIQAAMLLSQLDRLDGNLERREIISRRYEEVFSGISDIDMIKVLPDVKSARNTITILVDKDIRDKVMHELQDRGIGVAVNFRPIHLMKYYRDKYGYKEGMFPNAESIGARTITLPLYPKLKDEEQEYIISNVRSIVSGK